MLTLLLPAFLLVVLGGLFAAAESAISSLSRADIQELALTSRARRSMLAISTDTGAYVNSLSFVRIIAETSAAVLVTLALAYTIDEWWITMLVAAAIMTAVSFVLVGASPRSVGRVHARPLLAWTALLVRVIRVAIGPVADALVALGNRVTPGRPKTVATFTSEEQLLSMVDEATELEVLEEDDRELIHSIFEFNDTVVREVMIPRTDMVVVEQTVHVGSALGLFLTRGISRAPVTGRDSDEIEGVLYLRDLARMVHERPEEAERTTVDQLARPAVFVPESQKADALLRQMQLESNHLAMVVDEYGGIAGLVTLEDLIEELVGDISDEYDRDVPEFEDLGDGVYRVSARLPIDELGDLFGLELDDDDVDSAGGLLAKTLGRLPERGSVVRVGGLVLTADRVEGRRTRISTILVERDRAGDADDDHEAAPAGAAASRGHDHD
ncbi:Magnesium and cobalt efflux protein CorC [Clavibacter michiganensis]|uniref:Magnesium and cobalt efflux protein CorC n=1 Tax=Clavibacter michiganensis TaxID=28447 RepID=A0A251Y344_9MICO|nr:hemolysin family protein [Clavibacter michiganensis]OUE18710.1 Magnesium and cobalt efflux protein CorC [Clavibacter michiganensis]